MAQDFESNGAQITNSATTIFTSNSDDAVISIRLANIAGAAITADVFVTVSAANYYLVKGITIPSGSSVELIDGASRFVMVADDILKVASNTSAALDVWVSVVDAISA